LGGHVAGDVASRTVIDALQSFDHATDPANLTAALGRAVGAASEALRRRITTQPELAGMGSTLVALLWSGSTAAVANVGDSRLYLVRDGVTRQITEDHTYEHLVADAARVPNLPERLARWLDGRADGRSPDLTSWDPRPTDRFLLCSDGLSSYVPRELIDTTLNASSRPDEIADQLVTLALGHGGPDNITVIVGDFAHER
jgi:protein phosphatase